MPSLRPQPPAAPQPLAGGSPAPPSEALKVAIVGCGKIADAHVEEVRKQPHARLVAVCDLEPLMAEQLAVRYGVPRHYADFAELLAAERPDVVHITTPPQAHYALTTQAVDAGCHVYVEKPLTLDHESTRSLVDYVAAAGKKLTIGYITQFDPAARRLRQLAAEGVLGEPVHVECFMGYSLNGPFGAAVLADSNHWVHRLPGKLFHNNLDHLVSKAIEFLGETPPTVSAHAFARRELGSCPVRNSMMDELRVVLHGEQTSAYLTFSSHAKPAGYFLKVYGTKNTVLVDYIARTVTVEPQSKLPGVFGRLATPFEQARRYWREGVGNVRRFLKADYHYFAGMNWLIHEFYRSIREGTPQPISNRDILRVSAIMDEIFAQVRPGGSGG